MIEITQELSIFLYAIWTGVVVVGSYCLICLWRRIKKHTITLINIEDFLFWAGSCIYVFCQIFQSSSGVIRWYFFAGVFLGGIASCILSKNCINIILIIKKYLKNRKN